MVSKTCGEELLQEQDEPPAGWDSSKIITRPVNADGTRHEVRVQFHRTVWKGHGQAGNDPIPPGEQMMEMIRDPIIYQRFFAKLSKAVFLEAHKI